MATWIVLAALLADHGIGALLTVSRSWPPGAARRAAGVNEVGGSKARRK